MKKINFKRFLPAIGILVAIIIIIIVIVTSSKKSEENKSDSGMNTGNIETGTVSNTEENQGQSEEENATEESLDVPQANTTSTNEYVDNTGATIEEGTVESIQAQIEEKFKSIPLDRLQLNGVDLENAKLIFGEGVMRIGDKDCFGFTVYVANGKYMKSAGMYAMSKDTEVLYRYDTDTLTYIFVNMD